MKLRPVPRNSYLQQRIILYLLPRLLLKLHNSLTDSDGLFFIQYFPENTIKSCWFLVQINHIETEIFNMDSKRTGDYHVTFLSRHPNDNNLCDDNARWWPLWYKYKMIRMVYLSMVLVCC